MPDRPSSAWRAYAWLVAIPIFGALAGAAYGVRHAPSATWELVGALFGGAFGAGVGLGLAMAGACAVAIVRRIRRRGFSASSLILILALIAVVALSLNGLWVAYGPD